MAKFIQPAFSKGEIAPDLFGRVDTDLYPRALKRARNVFIHPFGGASNRPGLKHIGPVANHTRTPRLVPFKFKETDTHIIEVGHQYIRIIRNDAHVLETPLATVTNASQTNPVVITTSVAHGFSNGEEVFLAGIGGMLEISNAAFIIGNVTATTFEIFNQVTNLSINGTGFTAYTSGGTAGVVFTLSTPYLESELRQIKFTQSADVMTLTHPNHEQAELKRLALDNWTLTEIPFTPSQAVPTSVAITPRTTGTTKAKYKVTATSADGEESLPGLTSVTKVITNITQANPAVVTTSAAHALDTGDEIQITGVVGMIEVNNRRFRINNLTATTFELRDVDSTNFLAYSSGGTVTNTFAVITNSHANFLNDISWAVVAGASFYSIYREESGLYGFVGESEGVLFADDKTAITSDKTETPPQQRNPFFGTGNFPGAVGSHQQRRVYGGSDNKPDTSFYSRIAATSNFSVAIPSRDDDAITAVLPATQVEQIRHFVSIGDLLLFTSGAEWLVKGGVDAGFTAATISQEFQSNWGSSHLRPLVVGNTVLFVVDPGVAVRALGFSLQSDSFSSSSVSLLIPHLLRNRLLLEWDYARTPDSLAYSVRDDGNVLCLTFEEEQQVTAWAEWDTQGKFESVAVIRPSPSALTDAGYFVVKRIINNTIVRSIERTADRQFKDVRDCFFVDNGLTFDNPLAIESIDEANPVKITITGHGLANDDEVDISDIVWVANVDADFNETQPNQLNDGRFKVANVTANDFTLKSIDTGNDIDGSAFNAYVESGFVRKAVQTIFGLQHLANTPVVALADGNVIRNLTVSPTGSLTFVRKFSRIHVGLPYISDVETLSLEAPGETVQGVLKKITKATVRFTRSRGLLVGPTKDALIEMKQREDENLAQPTLLQEGDTETHLLADWNTDGRFLMRQKDPLPMTILAVVLDVE